MGSKTLIKDLLRMGLTRQDIILTKKFGENTVDRWRKKDEADKEEFRLLWRELWKTKEKQSQS